MTVNKESKQKQAKDIRVLAYIVNEPNGKPQQYLVVNTKIDAVTGVLFEQLYNMRNEVENIKSIDLKTRKITFTDCASDRVPVVIASGFGFMESVKDGNWIVGKYEDCDIFFGYSCSGNKSRFTTKELLDLHAKGLLVNATVVQNKYVRGINWTIPVIGTMRQLVGLKSTTITIEKDGIITVELTSKELDLTEENEEIVDSTGYAVGAKKECYVRFSNKNHKKIVDLLSDILGDKEEITRIETTLVDKGSRSNLSFKARIAKKGEIAPSSLAVSTPQASDNAHICVDKYSEILGQLMILLNKNDLCQSRLTNEIMETVLKFRKEDKATNNSTSVDGKVSNEKVTGLDTVGITIESYEGETFIACEIVAEIIKVSDDVKAKLDEGSTNNYIKYTIDDTQHAINFLRSFLKGLVIPKMAIVLVDRVLADEESKIFLEAVKGSQDVVCKVNGKGKDAVQSCHENLSTILSGLAKHSIIDTYMNRDIHRTCKKYLK